MPFKNSQEICMFQRAALPILLLAAVSAFAVQSPTVDCAAGQTIRRALTGIDKTQPSTLTIKGTCTEYVLLEGFNNLTVNGLEGATLQQPDTTPPTNPGYVLLIRASRSVTISGLAIRALPTIFSSIGVAQGSSDIVLRNVSTDGPWGIEAIEASQVWLVRVTVNTTGFAGISVFDESDVHIVGGLVKRPASTDFLAGILVGSGHVTMQGMTIRDMQQSISIGTSGSVDTVAFDLSSPNTDVVIDNPAASNFYGVFVADSSSLNIGSAKLRINGAGQIFGGDTGGVLVTSGSTLNGGANLIVTNSHSQGVTVSNNSHAQLAGASITGSAHGGLVVTNLSTATVDITNPLTVISGNGTDLFCDSKSQIAGSANIANATTVQCANLLTGSYESLP